MTNEDGIINKKQLFDHRLNERSQVRGQEVEAARKARSEAGQETTEELVKQFYRDVEIMKEEIEHMLSESETMPKEDVTQHLDKIMLNIQKMQEYVTDSGIFLPSYDLKKSQTTISLINAAFIDVQDKVKPKKKFGFKKAKQKGCSNKNPDTPDISNLSLQSSFSNILGASSCGVSSRTGEKIILTRDQVTGRDVGLEQLTKCRVEIHGSPSTIHMAKIDNCSILTGPVSTSVFIDSCTQSTLALACQQLRTHQTDNTDIYLHTTSKAIIEDCSSVRVAPFTWSYPGIDEDYTTSGLSRETNNWDKVGDFNWLATDKQSPNWCILPERERKLDL